MTLDVRLVETMARIGGLAGLGLATFLLLFMSLIKNTNLFSAMDRNQTYKTVRTFMVLTSCIAALCLGVWAYSIRAGQKSSASVDREYTFRGQELTPEMLPAAMTHPPPNEGLEALMKQVSANGSLVLDHCILTLAPIGAKANIVIALHTLTLANQTRIITNGNTLHLIASRIVANDSEIVSFPDPARTVPDAPPGESGIAGSDGGEVDMTSQGLQGLLTVILVGQNGSRGGQGVQGVQGPPGPRGSNAVQGFVDCRSGGGNGGQGGLGGPGGPGKPGGNGGAGGILILRGGLAMQTSSIVFFGSGGTGGAGGMGGSGGPGGPGGEGGSGSASCSGGRAGPPGPAGAPGLIGSAGADGKRGLVKTLPD